MPLNRYQEILPKKIFQCALAFSPQNDPSHIFYKNHMRQKDIANLIDEYPDMIIRGGSVNGYLLAHLPFCRDLAGYPVQTLYENIDRWIADGKLIPPLYLVGGYYPHNDGSRYFEAQCDGNKIIYVWAGMPPWTDLPVYEIHDDQLIRCKHGEIPSPAKVTIGPSLHEEIMTSLNTREPFTF